jgi:hypothetical protein
VLCVFIIGTKDASKHHQDFMVIAATNELLLAATEPVKTQKEVCVCVDKMKLSKLLVCEMLTIATKVLRSNTTSLALKWTPSQCHKFC